MAYTYLIGWSEKNKYYYGARWAKDCTPADLWVTYFTSSKHVANFRKEFGEPDVIQIRQEFAEAGKCKLYENKVLQRLNVLTNDTWLNKNINGLFLPTGPQTAEHIGKRVTQGLKTKEVNGTLHRSTWANQTKEQRAEISRKLSASQTGVKKSAEHVANMRNRPQDTMRLTCPHCGKEGDYKNMKRWHMDRCKLIPQSSEVLAK